MDGYHSYGRKRVLSLCFSIAEGCVLHRMCVMGAACSGGCMRVCCRDKKGRGLGEALAED